MSVRIDHPVSKPYLAASEEDLNRCLQRLEEEVKQARSVTVVHSSAFDSFSRELMFGKVTAAARALGDSHARRGSKRKVENKGRYYCRDSPCAEFVLLVLVAVAASAPVDGQSLAPLVRNIFYSDPRTPFLALAV